MDPIVHDFVKLIPYQSLEMKIRNNIKIKYELKLVIVDTSTPLTIGFIL